MDEMVALARSIVASGGSLTVRSLAQRAFLSPSTVQVRIGSMARLEEAVARQIADDFMALMAEERPMVDAERRHEVRGAVQALEFTTAELLFAWERLASFPRLEDARNRVFSFVWPQIDPAHYEHWAPHLSAAIPPMIISGRDPSSPVKNVHAAMLSSYEEWLGEQVSSGNPTP